MLCGFLCFDFLKKFHLQRKVKKPQNERQAVAQRCSVKKVFLEILQRFYVKFTDKQLCQSVFFNKVAGLKPSTLLKKRL